MNFDVTRVGPLGPTPAPAGPPPRAAARFAEALGSAAADVLPASPPTDAMRDVEAAERRYLWLHEQGRELHFEVDRERNRVRIEVRDLDGRVVRELTLGRALAAIAGGPFE